MNIAWALPYTAIQLTSVLLKKVGFKKIDKLMQKVPAGLKTSVQEEINSLIFTQLLELPNGKGRGQDITDALLAEILDQPEVKSIFQDRLALIMNQSQRDGFRAALEKTAQGILHEPKRRVRACREYHYPCHGCRNDG